MSILYLDDDSVHLHDYRTSARRGAATTVTITLTIAEPYRVARIIEELQEMEATQKAAAAAKKAAEREAAKAAKKPKAIPARRETLLLTYRPDDADDDGGAL